MLDHDQLKQITYAIDDGIRAGLGEQPTLRDRLAMAVLPGTTSGFESLTFNPEQLRKLAKNAYALADAMLEARKVTP